MPVLNPKALAEARRKKRWTQDQLSEATKPQIATSTISRIERGKPTRVRERTLKELARALDVSPESLCEATEMERAVMKIRIDSAARNALTLVAGRYQISRDQIVAAAPLLFFIAAEQCLKERQRRIAEVRASADALFDLYRGIPHLPAEWPVDEGAVSSEEQSIKARDLFGEMVLDDAQQFMTELGEDYDETEQNPFVMFLRDSLSKVSNSTEAAKSVWWPPGSYVGPHYEICGEEAAAIVGGDTEATGAILCGAAALHEMPKASPEERARWARAELERGRAELADMLGLKPGETSPITPGDGAAL
jgi:transcriptional regulator with XRE-family HTH domain